MKKLSIAVAIACSGFISLQAFAVNDLYNGTGNAIFQTGEVINVPEVQNGFRIPAITSLGNGVLIAAADVRYRGSAWSDIFSGGMYKVKLSTKISYDGGKTWSDLNIIGGDSSDYNSIATDPAIVHDKKSGNILMFGLRNNRNLVTGAQKDNNDTSYKYDDVTNIPADHKPDFLMYTSKDGKTWSERSIYDEVINQINSGITGTVKYKTVFQGPSGAMYYKDKVYVPVQAWANNVDFTGNSNGSKFMATSGFMVSADGGKTWKVSSMLIKDPNAQGDIPKSSEANIFHYKGKIRLAVRQEEWNKNPNSTDSKGKNRLVYEYDDKTDTWTDVTHTETFIPYDVAQSESATHNLNEDVYMVTYIQYYRDQQENNDRRRGQYLVTNTGIKIKLSEDKSEGYTSITSDDSNIYAMYEGRFEKHDIFMKVIDWKHKDYANLNTQILNRARNLNYIQDTFAQKGSYIQGSFGSEKTAGAELIIDTDKLKLGAFINDRKDLDKDMSEVLQYDNRDITLIIGKDNLIFDKDNLFFGYMNSNIKYDNGSENKVDSYLLGYSLRYDFEPISYKFSLNGMISSNSFERNRAEGLGKTAEFDSKSISMTNSVVKDLNFNNYGSLSFESGLVTTHFSHESFREEGGEGTDEFGRVGANNATFQSNSMLSNEIFVKADYTTTPISINNDSIVTFGASIKYAIDLSDKDKWFDEYRTMSVDRKFDEIGELYSARDNGYLKANLSANFNIFKNVDIKVVGDADSIGDREISAKLKYSF